jgi:formamidopyrimidine-DNA glycosylase
MCDHKPDATKAQGGCKIEFSLASPALGMLGCDMPELPEVEVLVRHLDPALRGRRILGLTVCRPRSIRGTALERLTEDLTGATFQSVKRRGKYLVFSLRRGKRSFVLVGHLGMTGRMYLQRRTDPLPRHTAAWLDLGPRRFVFEDTRYFGRLTLDTSAVEALGAEPMEREFPRQEFLQRFRASKQTVKARLLDQALLAGVGNIYASEALFRSGIRPTRRADRLRDGELLALCRAVQNVLRQAIRFGSTIPLNFGRGKSDGLFYYGRKEQPAASYEERLLVYDRAGLPCSRCKTPVRRIVQGGRSSFFCPNCQR